MSSNQYLHHIQNYDLVFKERDETSQRSQIHPDMRVGKDNRTLRVLMVCLGNICRSPMAQGVLEHCADQRNLPLEIDSAGTSRYHVGDPPDGRACTALMRHGIDIRAQRARQFSIRDFRDFDMILTADQSNYDNVVALAPTAADAERVHLMLDWSAPGSEVPDPYYGGNDGFDHVYQLLAEGCVAFLDDLERS